MEKDFLLEELHKEQVIKKKYSLECPDCKFSNNFEDGEEDIEPSGLCCRDCGKQFTWDQIVTDSVVRYKINKKDFMDFISVNYPQEYIEYSNRIVPYAIISDGISVENKVKVVEKTETKDVQESINTMLNIGRT